MFPATVETCTVFILGVLQNHCRCWLQPWNYKMFAPSKESYDQPRQHIKKQRHYFVNKVHLVKAMVFPVVIYGYESWTIKKAECWINWCFRTMVLEKTLESPLDCKEIKPVHSKGNQSSIFMKDCCWSWNSNTLATWCQNLEPIIQSEVSQKKKYCILTHIYGI